MSELQQFERHWKAWATRKPRLAPQQAAAQVCQQAQRQDRWRGSRWKIVAAAAGVIIALTTGVLWRAGVVPLSSSGSTMNEPDAASDNVVVFWLDEETPLYMTFQAPRDNQDEGGAP